MKISNYGRPIGDVVLLLGYPQKKFRWFCFMDFGINLFVIIIIAWNELIFENILEFYFCYVERHFWHFLN